MISPACQRYLDEAQLFGIKLGLDNMRSILSHLGQPEKNFPSIHVAGTNGKGSVSAMLERIFQLNGFKTGLYTSPHLIDIRERISLNGRMIPEKTFCCLLLEIKKKEKKLKKAGEMGGSLTFFEILTLCAFDYFSQEKVDLAVFEVGLGGRFDATNVITPEISVITSISYDHQQYLGKTMSKIAGEKAGIIKRGVPCISGVRNQTALNVIEKKCQEMGAPLIKVFGRGRELTHHQMKDGYLFSFKTPCATYRFRPSLPGLHQGENAAIAITAAEAMQEHGYQLQKDKVIEALETVVWPGRLEIISRTPLIILDGGHNEDAARAVSDYIRENIGQPVILVFAIMKDKDIEKVASKLFPLASRIILTRPPMDRAARPRDIARRLPEFSQRFFLEEDVPSALRLALTLSSGKVPVVVGGSLFLVGEVKKFFSELGAGKSLAYV
ncbi:MAG TPA: folylpolyglutamate synthase/dihydrofolate synthase family protein [Candidatus Saccharicenans sp.]|jgi:dihydrofolate synthase/folylpolyglutamate synthase|nr:bifunctional folylpolyglutamate synthase/dihydrofolate synthase [Candidatus Saccharicenans sp.]HRD02509.1 folylpolyglutamate synthase/dihydrofolate synthase family protein [Candidatus Saccharicenans sp.]